MKRFVSVLILVCAVFGLAGSLYAESGSDNMSISFTIAPPPIGYPTFEKSSLDKRFGLNMLSFDSDFLSIVGGGINGTLQQGLSDKVAWSGQAGLSVMSGDVFDLSIMQLMYRLNIQAELLKMDNVAVQVFAGIGNDISFNKMYMVFPQVVNLNIYYDNVEIATTTVMTTMQGGVQANIGLSSFILSPFGYATWTKGNSNSTYTSSMSFSYADTSTEVPSFTSIIYGFDLLYKPMNLSLSSMIQVAEEFTSFTLSVSKTFRRLVK